MSAAFVTAGHRIPKLLQAQLLYERQHALEQLLCLSPHLLGVFLLEGAEALGVSTIR
jgi:hypothetical protein